MEDGKEDFWGSGGYPGALNHRGGGDSHEIGLVLTLLGGLGVSDWCHEKAESRGEEHRGGKMEVSISWIYPYVAVDGCNFSHYMG